MDACALTPSTFHHRCEGDAGDAIGEQLSERSEFRPVLKACTAEAIVEKTHVANGNTCGTHTTDTGPLERLIHHRSIANRVCDFFSVLADATNLIAVCSITEGERDNYTIGRVKYQGPEEQSTA
eukprot:scaffold25972_cov32-Tisochrysis_lutea.AAC.2